MEGAKAFRIGELQRAADAFKAAYEACPSPLFLYNLGQVSRQLRDNEKALYFYKQYESTTSPNDPRRADVQKWINQLQEQIDNQRKIQESPPPGPVVLEPTPRQSATSEPSANEPTASPTAERPSQRRPWYKNVPGMALTGGGVALVGVGGGLLGYSLTLDHKAASAGTVTDFNRSRDSAVTFNSTGWALVGVGAAAVVTGGVLLILSATRKAPRMEARR